MDTTEKPRLPGGPSVKAVEARTRELADHLTTALESLTDGFFTIDREWRFTYVNRAAEQMFRLSAGGAAWTPHLGEISRGAGHHFPTGI